MPRLALKQLGFLLSVGVFLYASLVYVFYTNVATRVLGANDYYSRWEGARQFFIYGLDPYSDQVTQRIQMGMFGQLVPPNEDQVAFAYPFYAAFYTYPFITLPFALAASFWIGLLILLIAGAALALAQLFEWRLAPLGFLGVLLFALFSYPSVRGFFLGQYALLVTAGLALSLLLLKYERDAWAGGVLALCTVKPHIIIIALIVLLTWGAWHRRWRLIAGFIAGLSALVLASLLVLPAWIGEFIGALGRYKSYIEIGSPLQVLLENFLPVAQAARFAQILSILLLLALGYRVWRTLDFSWQDFLPTVELALIVTTLAMVRTATTDQTLLLAPWIHWLANLARAKKTGQAIAAALGVVALPWLLFLFTVRDNQEAPIATTGMVTLTLLAYVLVYWRAWMPARGKMIESSLTMSN